MYTIPLSYMAFESKDIYNERKIFNSVEYTKRPWNKEYIKLDRDKSTFKSHRDFSSEKEITKTIIIFFITCSLLFQL